MQNVHHFHITYNELFSEVVDHGVLGYGDGQGAFLRVVDGGARAALLTGLQPLRLLQRDTRETLVTRFGGAVLAGSQTIVDGRLAGSR